MIGQSERVDRSSVKSVFQFQGYSISFRTVIKDRFLKESQEMHEDIGEKTDNNHS